MQISNNFVLVRKQDDEVKEGFKEVEIQDSFVYKGVVEVLPEAPVFLGNKRIAQGDVVLFAKYSPDTVEIDLDGIKKKFVKTSDILAVL